MLIILYCFFSNTTAPINDTNPAEIKLILNNVLSPVCGFLVLTTVVPFSVVVAYESGANKCKVIDIKTGKIQSDKNIIDRVMFANMWLTAAGIKWMYGEPVPGYDYAFCEAAEELYDTMCDQLREDCLNNGVINPPKLLKTVEENVFYKYGATIMNRLFKTPYQTELINTLFLHSVGIKNQQTQPTISR